MAAKPNDWQMVLHFCGDNQHWDVPVAECAMFPPQNLSGSGYYYAAEGRMRIRRVPDLIRDRGDYRIKVKFSDGGSFVGNFTFLEVPELRTEEESVYNFVVRDQDGSYMKEHEWWRSKDPVLMFQYLQSRQCGNFCNCPDRKAYNRKLRLFAAGCCRLQYPHPHSYQPEFDVWELQGHPHEISDAHWASAWARAPTCKGGAPDPIVRAHLLRDIFGNPFRPVEFKPPPVNLDDLGARETAWRRVGQRPNERLQYMPDWLTPNIIAIARAIYEDMKFDKMKVELHDALEEAGCTEEEILRHCRGYHMCPFCGGSGTKRVWKALEYGPFIKPMIPQGKWEESECVCKTLPNTNMPPAAHMRGCWVIDLILGK